MSRHDRLIRQNKRNDEVRAAARERRAAEKVETTPTFVPPVIEDVAPEVETEVETDVETEVDEFEDDEEDDEDELDAVPNDWVESAE